MKQVEEDIGKLKEKIIIGKTMGGADSKPEICERLSHHFLKKLNLIASVNMAIKSTTNRVDALKQGGQCFLEKPNKASNIKYHPVFAGASALQYNKLPAPYTFSKRHILEVDGDEIRKLAFEKINKDKRGGKLLKQKAEDDQYYLPEASRNNLLIREISKPEVCKNNGGAWLNTEQDLVKHGLKPNTQVAGYNKAWNDVVTASENVISTDSQKLLTLLDKVMYEDITEIDGVKQKRYIDRPINDKELSSIISDSKKLINNMLSEVDKVFLITSSLPMVSDNEIKNKEQLEKEKQELEKRLQHSKTRLSLSN